MIVFLWKNQQILFTLFTPLSFLFHNDTLPNRTPHVFVSSLLTTLLSSAKTSRVDKWVLFDKKTTHGDSSEPLFPSCLKTSDRRGYTTFQCNRSPTSKPRYVFRSYLLIMSEIFRNRSDLMRFYFERFCLFKV